VAPPAGLACRRGDPRGISKERANRTLNELPHIAACRLLNGSLGGRQSEYLAKQEEQFPTSPVAAGD